MISSDGAKQAALSAKASSSASELLSFGLTAVGNVQSSMAHAHTAVHHCMVETAPYADGEAAWTVESASLPRAATQDVPFDGSATQLYEDADSASQSLPPTQLYTPNLPATQGSLPATQAYVEHGTAWDADTPIDGADSELGSPREAVERSPSTAAEHAECLTARTGGAVLAVDTPEQQRSRARLSSSSPTRAGLPSSVVALGTLTAVNACDSPPPAAGVPSSDVAAGSAVAQTLCFICSKPRSRKWHETGAGHLCDHCYAGYAAAAAAAEPAAAVQPSDPPVGARRVERKCANCLHLERGQHSGHWRSILGLFFCASCYSFQKAHGRLPRDDERPVRHARRGENSVASSARADRPAQTRAAYEPLSRSVVVSHTDGEAVTRSGGDSRTAAAENTRTAMVSAAAVRSQVISPSAADGAGGDASANKPRHDSTARPCGATAAHATIDGHGASSDRDSANLMVCMPRQCHCTYSGATHGQRTRADQTG